MCAGVSTLPEKDSQGEAIGENDVCLFGKALDIFLFVCQADVSAPGSSFQKLKLKRLLIDGIS